MTIRILLILCLSLATGAVHAVAPVEAVALFKDRAVVRTSKEQAMLRVGQTSEHGVQLLKASPRGATVRYGGEVYKIQLSTRVGTHFATPKSTAVRINEDSYGQYRVRGAINGHYVNFLVDTGASVVALSERQARGMDLDYESGQTGRVETAQGLAEAYFFPLNEVTLGGITVRGVQATVIKGDYPVDVLLGMSFLNKVKMQNESGVLVLSARH